MLAILTNESELDNPINQTILSTFMKKKKIKYDIANNGAEAVAKWKAGGLHLILVCISLVFNLRRTEGYRDGYSNARHGWHPSYEGD